MASQEDLQKLRQRLATLPPWLAEALEVYLSWRWPTWRAQTAYQLGLNLIGVMRRLWTWLKVHRQVTGWWTHLGRNCSTRLNRI